MDIIFGDVLLLNGVGKLSKPNKIFQTKRRKNEAAYSHVALCLGPNIVAHAMPKQGVHIVTFESILEEFGEDWMVIRNKTLAATAKDSVVGAEYAMDALYHLGKRYDLLTIFSGKKADESFVCSNFVAACLNTHNIKVGRTANDVLPVDFQLCLESDEWADVTSEHKGFYKYSCNDYAEQQIETYYQIWNNAKSLAKLYELARKFDEAHKRLDKIVGYQPVELEQPDLGFWDTDLRK
ncbi:MULTISPECIES: YiiX/YebB-like N1pC/P60 family cysteine hydrolase [Vibrio]|uniref:YiiX/YebB-like N1pC/P60 family cysteine hydrolase n=1 Tax=Vibrio TaxID=662 RepID=UPI001EFEAF8D|nr:MULTISPECIES: YiiX/YebB-like N1pC/P60 family cysteine hydrolase [Vibrio]MCG9677530.1 hypothetical protein [Vibrio sp. Isolate24]USD35076.1 hypothetical protein J8Z27_17405 [Vibrio sp. SCSIO 43186]USD48142.1 hypothetical protein J4N38_17795 [Vibrio sp. SCSIO 43145]USD72201.1 hypothetical protein J4N41_17415 [Vibrio sp. SCSIO 43139]USD97874.1 hypothetical protein CTT30_17615 [Vibrio coralliilyticus]